MVDFIKESLLKVAETGIKNLQNFINEKADEALDYIKESRVRPAIYFFEDESERDEYDANWDSIRRSVMLNENDR